MENNYETKARTYIEIIRPRWITIVLIVINIAVFVILEVMGDTESADFMYGHGAMYPPAIDRDGEYWRLFTAAFLHFGLGHLLNNMVILACAGPFLEHALGHFKYLLLYVMAAIGSNLLSFYQMSRSGEYAVSAGASGAIFGVIGGLLWVVIRHRGNYETLTTKGLIFMIVLCLYYGISTAGVDNWSHVGGLCIGFAASLVLYRMKRQDEE